MTYEIGHAAWNKGRIIGQKKPLKLQEVQMIRVALESEERRRDSVMFELAIDSKLSGILAQTPLWLLRQHTDTGWLGD